MMRLILTVCLLAGVAQAVPQKWHVNPIGDARKAMHIGDITRDRLAGGGLLEVEIPKGKWEDLTFTYWMRHGWGSSAVDPERYYQTVHLVYCPEPIQRHLPDALEGAGGWGVEGGVEVDGALIIPYEYALHWTYTNRVFGDIREPYTHGVYSVNAICSAPMGLSLGGVEHTLQEGTNSFNSYGGWEDHVTITGSGNVQLGISQAYWHEYFSRINGVADTDNKLFLSKASIITNEMVFVSCRMKLNDTEHKTHDSMIHWEGNDVQGKTVTNSLPKNPDCRSFDSRGHYRVGLIGLGAQPERTTVDLFDFRIHPWWLSDEDLQRTFRNGKEEMARRGIAKHRAPLPAEYQAVEYLESTGTQYLLPDVGTLTANTSFKIKFIPTYFNPSDNNGVWGSSRGQRYCGFFMGGSNIFKTQFGNRVLDTDIGINQTVVWTQTGLAAEYTIDGIAERYTYPSASILDAYDFRLFSIGGWNANSWIKLFYFSVSDGDNPVRDLVPCVRKSDSVAGMYDLVSKQFFTNQGTGEFIVGPNIED